MAKTFYNNKPKEITRCIVSECEKEIAAGTKFCDYHKNKMPGDSYISSIPLPTKAQLMGSK
jgi:hypothetical protein